MTTSGMAPTGGGNGGWLSDGRANFALRGRAAVLLTLIALASPVVAAPAAAADAPVVREGVLEGAAYVISVPADWNGGLVMFAHGYEGEGPGSGSVRASPLNSYLRQHGVAWAASGYRSKGYRPDWFLADTLALREHFIKDFGPPRWTILHGQSMGGHVAIASLELHPRIYQGGFIECGVVDGVGLADWLAAYTAAAEYLSKLPLLETPRPQFEALANIKWLAVMGTPGHYTPLGREFDNVVMHLAGGDLPLRLEGMQEQERYVQNLNPRDPGSGHAQEFARHADTRHVRYHIDPGFGLDAAAINRDVPRIAPAAGARSRQANPVFAEFTGRISAPILTIHETGDFRAPFRLEQDYRRRVDAAGRGDLLVQRAVRGPGHCGFAGEVRERAFGDLVAWIERGVAPDGDDVIGDATKLGLRFTPTLHASDPARQQPGQARGP